MKTITGVMSLVHESPLRHSAARRFRNKPVLEWTIRRLSTSRELTNRIVMCWEDQLEAVAPIAAEHEIELLVKGPRAALPIVESIAAARRWSDGWRGGLLSTCDFDLGFYGPWLKEIRDRFESDALVLIDPSSGLIDPALIDGLIDHARSHPDAELSFSQAAPGLSGALVGSKLLDRLTTARIHPGKLLHYLPDQPARDPIGGEGCADVPTNVARTTSKFKLDSDRQVRRLEHATISLNGQLIRTHAEDLVHRIDSAKIADELPREVRLELTTRRATKPTYWPGRHLELNRPDMTPGIAQRVFEQLRRADDLRLTLAGVGDPLLHEEFFEIIRLARAAGIEAISIETDLLGIEPERVAALASAPVDIVLVHLPAMRSETYAAVMGVDSFPAVLENVKLLLENRQSRQRGVPLIVPQFTKCQANLGEMEEWYDQWLRILGSAVIDGPSDFAGQIPDVSLADMAPPRRSACARLASRLTILSDGTIVACEQDVLGKMPMGHMSTDDLGAIWQSRFNSLREEHRKNNLAVHPLCGSCKEWHRP